MARKPIYKDSERLDTTITLPRKVLDWAKRTQGNIAGWVGNLILKEYKKENKE